ncbi:MAG: hypothetical protein J5644_03680 [Bacteroidales bacterium]|nr:hypothetical protein [Bacteroidales bacterium]
MERIIMLCLLICWLIVFYTPLSAQSGLGVADYQRVKCEIVAAKPFLSHAWVAGACGNDYLLKELMRARIEAVLRYDRHAFVLQLSHNGYSRYGELTATLGYAVKFGGKVALGMRYYYLYQHVERYEAQHSISFDLSLYAQLSRKLCFGFEVYNPARLKYSIRGPDIIPMRFTVLAHYGYSEKLAFTVQILKYLPGKFDVSAGCYYQPLPYFYLSFACSLYDSVFGLMIRWKRFYFTVDARYNYRLGFAPEVGVGVRVGELTINN